MTTDAVRTGRISWSYAFAGFCFALLVAFHLDRGSTIWAGVFGLAALANIYLAVRPLLPAWLVGGARLQARRTGPAAPPSEPSPEQMRLALKAYGSRRRSWLTIAVAGWVTTVGVVLLVPILGLVAAALSLFAMYRYRRCSRSVRVLRDALDGGAEEASDNAGWRRPR